MNEYKIIYSTGKPGYINGQEAIIKGETPARAVITLMKKVNVNCILKIMKVGEFK